MVKNWIRKTLKLTKKKLKESVSELNDKVNPEKDDSFFLSPDVPSPGKVNHLQWQDYLFDKFNVEGYKILEIGSREVTGKSVAREKLKKADYTGFDFYPGDNVDIVGDAHKLSTYFTSGEKFDFIFSSACFEHFAMPWLVSTEISKLLKTGGMIFVETHFSFSSHERPWNFFQFSDLGLKILFPRSLGFECIEAGMSNPIVGRFSKYADFYLRRKPVRGLYCHSLFLGKKVEEVEDFKWEEVDLEDIVNNTVYPEPKNS